MGRAELKKSTELAAEETALGLNKRKYVRCTLGSLVVPFATRALFLIASVLLDWKSRSIGHAIGPISGKSISMIYAC